MKKYFAVLLFVFNSPVVSALNSVEKEGILVETMFSYKNKSLNVTNAKLQIFEADLKTWVPLTENKENVLLLGRLIEDNSGVSNWEFIVLDSSSVEPFVFSSNNSIIDENGKASLLSKTDTGATVEVSVKTTKTKFLEYPGASQEDVLKWMQR